MTLIQEVREQYYDWLKGLICGEYEGIHSYESLLVHLHCTDFTYTIANDKNREEAGIDLRYRFFHEHPEYENAAWCLKDRPCSVLEMMIALAIDCEAWMDEPLIGDRTRQWFWMMVVNLGLGSMVSYMYDRNTVNDILQRFLSREYEPNGKGGLFVIRGCDRDLRTVEIWYQMNWYMNSIT